ncbi:right-handed parallel beta-helix repeat-containing protein [Planctomycetota bacterium]
MANKSSTFRDLVVTSMFLLVVAGFAQAGTITIGPLAGHDFDTIQAGIDAAIDGDTVLVAHGEYVITEPITFRGKAIAVQSEAGRDETTIRMDTPADTNRGSVVIFENNETNASVLDGFTITGGGGSRLWISEESEFDWAGGGIFFDASSGTMKNCAIMQNRVKDVGGGVMAYSNSSVTMNNCIISGNSATTESGGGVCCGYDSSVTMTYCTIVGNSVGQVGGGVISYSNSSVTMNYCTIMENSAAQGGGGVFCGENSSSVTMAHCAIIGNTAGIGGGGLEIWHQASAALINCVIARNTTVFGGGIICAPYGYQGCSVTVTNSILWGNNASQGREIRVENPATFSISYSNVAGGQTGVSVESGGTLNWGEGNIDADPLFACIGYWNDKGTRDPSDDVWVPADYHLKSQAGRWDCDSQTWVQDEATSPCIDAGDPMSPIGLERFPNGGFVNMGAYGGMPEASKSYFGEPVCETIVAGDINGDGQVNRTDLEIMALHWTDEEPLPLP